MHSALTQVDHRPWPLPNRPWTWRQTWHDLLFAHWPIAAAKLRPLVPAGLTIQEFEGTSWIGVVPFRMTGVIRRPLPDLPWISAFPELNVRVYVEREGKAGVWFLSLDASSWLAVWTARRFFHLPYHRAKMAVIARSEGIEYHSERPTAEFQAGYRPMPGECGAAPGSLEHWLTERYCLYAEAPDRSLWRTEVHHHPWPLQPAEATIGKNTMIASHGLSVDDRPPLLHFARRVDVIVWSPERVG